MSWSAVSGATSYELQEKVNSGAWVTIQNTSATSKALSGKGNGTYSYQVRACNDSGCSVFSATKSTVVLLPPVVPTGLTSPGPIYSEAMFFLLSVHWNSVATAINYQLQMKKIAIPGGRFIAERVLAVVNLFTKESIIFELERVMLQVVVAIATRYQSIADVHIQTNFYFHITEEIS